MNRTSKLALGSAVTVEVEGMSQVGTLQPGKGSYWAEVVSVPLTTPADTDTSDAARARSTYISCKTAWFTRGNHSIVGKTCSIASS